jgi:hypothetical protein
MRTGVLREPKQHRILVQSVAEGPEESDGTEAHAIKKPAIRRFFLAEDNCVPFFRPIGRQRFKRHVSSDNRPEVLVMVRSDDYATIKAAK